MTNSPKSNVQSPKSKVAEDDAEIVSHIATEHGQIGAFKYCPQITQIKDGKTLAFRIREK